ncbi:MAG: hypothetical protein OXC28_07105 [Defluviicoccus sp.]|nr:hypothetical protein [Defluviicoccus sp.]
MPDLDVALRLRADASGLVGEIRLSKTELDRLGREARRAGARAGRAQRFWRSTGRELEETRRRATALRLAMVALATGGTARVAAGFLKAASDAQELRSQFQAVFRELTGEARAWARAHADSVGRSSLDIEQYLATLQDTFVPLGFARREAFEFSRTLAQLGVDLASFKNAAEPETIDLLTSAIVGNHEAVRRFGIVITESTLKQELMAAGIAGGTRAATEQQKVLARLRIILRSTGDAQGDAARTADQYANRVRALTGDWRDFQSELGRSLLPSGDTAIGLLRAAIAEFRDGLDPDALGRDIEAQFRGVLLGAAGAADAIAAPLGIAATVVGELAAGFNDLPPWVQEIGLLGAVLLGRKGRLALLGTIAVSEIVGDLERTVDRMQGEAEARQDRIDRARLGRLRRNRERYGLEPTRQEENLRKRVEARAAARSRAGVAGAGLRETDGGPLAFDLSGGSLIGRAGSSGPGAQATLEALFRRLDAERRRKAAAPRTPLAIPDIPGAGGFEDVLGSAAGLAEAERAVEKFYRGLAENHRDAAGAIAAAELDLATPFERATAEAQRWRDETLAALDPTAEGYEDLAARIEAVYLERIARAAEESAERQKRAAEEARAGWEKALDDYAADAIDTSDEIAQATTAALRGMEDALVDFVRTGKLNFRSLVDSILVDLARIAIRAAIVGPLARALGGAFGGFGGGGGGFNFGPGANPFHAGGVAGAGRTVRYGVDPAAFAFAPRLHRGGIAGDEVPAILRRREGVFTPEQMAALGGLARGPRAVTVRIENRGAEQRISEGRATVDPAGWVIDVVTDDASRGGRTAQVFRAIAGGG